VGHAHHLELQAVASNHHNMEIKGKEPMINPNFKA